MNFAVWELPPLLTTGNAAGPELFFFSYYQLIDIPSRLLESVGVRVP